jgi:hypothetical protein
MLAVLLVASPALASAQTTGAKRDTAKTAGAQVVAGAQKAATNAAAAAQNHTQTQLDSAAKAAAQPTVQAEAPLETNVNVKNPTLPPPVAAPERPTVNGDVKLVFDREVFRYPGENRRDPFKPLTGKNQAGPLFEDLSLRMIIHSQVPRQSIAVLADRAKKIYRVRRGESLGNVTVVDISPTRVVFSVDEFGVRRQEFLSLKNDNQKEGANR